MEKITRTINTKEAQVIFYDVQEAKTGVTIFNVTGYGKTEEEILKKIRKNFEDSTIKYVAIKEVHEVSKLYSMDLDKFIQYAEQIEHR